MLRLASSGFIWKLGLRDGLRGVSGVLEDMELKGPSGSLADGRSGVTTF